MKVRSSNKQAALCLVLTGGLLAPLPAFSAQKPQYMPPEAPHLDASGFQQKPASSYQSSQSGSYANDYTSDAKLPAPAADTTGDRVKDLLHQALERHNQGDLGGAQRLFQQVLTMQPNNSDANFNLGAMAEDRGDLSGALSYYQNAGRANPADADVRDAISSVQDKMKQQQATQQLAQKQQLRGVAQDAATAYKAGHYDQSISDLQQIVQKTPDDASAYFGLGQAYRGKGDNQQARFYLGRAVALAPGNQLYQSTLNDLDRAAPQQTAQGTSGAFGNQGGLRHGHGNRGGNDYGDLSSDQSASGSGRSDQGQGLQNYSDSGPNMASNPGSDGQITPFTSQGSGALYGHEAANSNYAPMGMGGGGLGSMLGMGLLGGGISRMGGGGYGYGNAYPGRGRLVRNAVAGSLAGAAIGALANMHGAGGARAGAMHGAVTGGIMGLITGL